MTKEMIQTFGNLTVTFIEENNSMETYFIDKDSGQPIRVTYHFDESGYSVVELSGNCIATVEMPYTRFLSKIIQLPVHVSLAELFTTKKMLTPPNEEKEICGVYTLKNTWNGKIFCGYTADINGMEQHIFDCLECDDFWNQHVQNSHNAHGDVFVFKMVAYDDKWDICDAEDYYNRTMANLLNDFEYDKIYNFDKKEFVL